MMQINKHVLFLSYDGLTDPLGQSQVLPYLVGLTAEGYTFSIISAEKKDNYAKNKTIIEGICQKASIHWLPIFYTKKPPILSTLYDMLKMYRKATELYSQNPYQIIHCRSYLSAIIGEKLKHKWAIKTIFDIRGFWADERLDGKTWDTSKPHYKAVYNYFKRKEKQLFSEADAIISLTENAKKEITQSIAKEVSPNKISVIPCCADLDLFDRSKISNEAIIETKKRLGISENQAVLSYLGSVGSWYRLDEMAAFFLRFKKAKPDAKFLIISASDKDYIANVMRQQGVGENDFVITKAIRSEVPTVLACSDFSLFFYDQVYSIKACSPTKQGEIMSLGIPIVCNDEIGDTSDILAQYEAGITISAFSQNEYDKAIKQLLETTFDTTKIKKGAIEYFDLEKGIAKYVSVYKCILN